MSLASFTARTSPAGRWTVYLGVATALGVFLGVVGPYGSFLNGPVHVRIGYWVGTVWLGAAVLGLAVALAGRAARRLRQPAWTAPIVALLLGGAPLATIVSLVARTVWPAMPALSWFDWYAQVLGISAFQFVIYGLVEAALQQRGAGPPQPSAAPPAQAQPRPFAAEALCLQMEDHYVRIHTSTGSRLVHGAFRHAVAAQAGIEGLQVHRSWWVARAAVRGVAWEGRNLRLELVNGGFVPVARSQVARLRAAGWLDQPADDPGAATAI